MRNVKRTSVAVLAVGGGVVAFLLAGGFIAYIFKEMREATIHSQLGHVQIVRPGYFEKGIADPFSFLLPADPERMAQIEASLRPETLAPRMSFSGLISRGDATMPFIADGIDPAKEEPISSRIMIVEGRALEDVAEKSVVVGEGLAAGLGVKVGESVVLLATKENGTPNAVELKVVGIFATSTKDYDDYALRVPIPVARKLMAVTGSTSWVILLAATDRTEAAVKALAKALPKGDFEVVPWTALADFYNKTVVLFSKQVSVVKFIIGLIIILTISNTQMMTVLERTTEIGTSMAIGLKRWVIVKFFLLEGLILGIVGGVAGIVLGYLLGELISWVGIPMPAPPGMARGYIGKILITPELVVDALVLAVVTTLAASIMPAWKAGSMNIVDALRTNQ
ncbi:MAG TPA: ABC transporter permease [Rhodocyclaceae bacterium]|nr:ABC transporter permease [Rhodocyclaceae bacterium]HMV20927.1 ABC transporter permease [Rhodocyclaceae bacterium]HMW76580.1 ABC transporter permease [Rhodocyclaceae bacterium]HNE42804.1 ABC transporter permease [Rhodocyclaceae bacterium]HNL20423.1 ABC transporter permease [Rhodocyclaceae bacterium]